MPQTKASPKEQSIKEKTKETWTQLEASVCYLGVMPKRKGIQTAGKIEMFGKPGLKLVIIAAAASPLWGEQAGHETSDLQGWRTALVAPLSSCSTVCK